MATGYDSPVVARAARPRETGRTRIRPALLAPGIILLGAGLGLLTATIGFGALAVVIGVVAVALPLSSSSLAVTTAMLVCAPDSPAFIHFRGLQITPRTAALAILFIQCAVATCAGKLKPALTFPGVWAAYTGTALLGAVAAGRSHAVLLFLFFVVLPFTAGCTVGLRPELVRGVIHGLVGGACVLSALAITEFVRSKPFFAPVYAVATGDYTRSGNLRANAGWVHPLALGMFFTLVAFLVIDEARRKGGLVAGVGGALLLAGGLFATQERSPLLGAAVGALAYTIAQLDSRRRRQALSVAAVMLIAAVALPGSRGAAFRTFLDQSTSAQTGASVNISGRIHLLNLGIGAVKTRPLLGFGYGAGQNVAGDSALRPLLTQGGTTYTDIADAPLAVAVETGIAGLAALALVVAGTLQRMIRARSNTYPVPVIALAAGLIAALVSSLGVAETTSGAIFLFALGLCSTACRLPPSGRTVPIAPMGRA